MAPIGDLHPRTRTLLFTTGAVALLVAVTAAAFVLAKRAREANAWVSHTHEVRDQVDAAMLALIGEESSQRGYLLTGDDTFLTWGPGAEERFRESVTRLQALVGDNPAELERARNLQAVGERRLAVLKALTAERQRGKFGPTNDALAAALAPGRELMKDVRAIVGQMQREEARLLAERDAAYKQIERWFLAGLLAAAAILLALGAGLVLIQRDLDNRERLEHRLLEEKRDRDRLIVDLARINGDLEASEAYQQQVMAIVSHDLRNPLSAIAMNAAILAKGERMTEERRLKTVARITSSAARMGRMIEDLFDYTVATVGKGIPIRPRDADVAAIASEAVNETRAGAPGRVLNLEVAGNLQGVWDPDRLHQVLQNLLGNALKYGDPAAAIEVRCVELAGGESIEIDVDNRGEAISPELLPHVFDAYRRGPGAGRHSLGLGLYIVRRIVEAHQGTILVTSSVEAGTRFAVRLPRKSVPMPVVAAVANATKALGGEPRSDRGTAA